MRRKRIRIRKKVLIYTAALVLLLTYIFCMCNSSAVILEFAGSAASSFFNRAMIGDLDEAEKYVKGLRTESNDYSGLSPDSASLALLKRKVTDDLTDKLSGNYTMFIPAGTFSGSKLFSGIGPGVPIVFHFSGIVDISVMDEIVSSGPGQSLYKLRILVEAELYCSNTRENYMFSTDIPVYDTVIVSRVPTIISDYSYE